MNRTVSFSLLAILLAFGFLGCNEKFTVKFDLDGGNISGDTTSVEIKVKSGEVIANLPNPKKDNFDFDGWFTQKNGAGTQFTTSTKVTSNLTVYAKWSTVVNTPFEGSWKGWNGDGSAIKYFEFSGNDFLIIIANENHAKGTFTYTANTITITVTHFCFDGINWLSEWDENVAPTPFILTVNYTISNDNLSLEGDGNGQPFIKQ